MKRNLVELMQTRFPVVIGLTMWLKSSYSLAIRVVHGVSIYYTVFMTLPCTESSKLLVYAKQCA